MAIFNQRDVQNPHFRLPMQFGGAKGCAVVNEQDTPDDIIDCIKTIVAYPFGTRHDMPEFGIPELLFSTHKQDKIQELRTAIEEWEERATISTESGPVVSDLLIWDILIKAGVVHD